MAANELRELIVARLKRARELAGLSQGQTAKLMGMHRPTISEIEAGRRRIAADELTRFAELFGVSVEWLGGQRGEHPDLDDPKLAMVAREIEKLKSEDIDQVLGFIAAVQGAGHVPGVD